MAGSLNDRNVDAYQSDLGAYVPIGGVGDAKKVTLVTANISGSISGLEKSTFTLVESGDINGTTYVTGSENSIKTVLTYATGASSGDYAILTTFQYGLTGSTKTPSDIEETHSTVP